MDNSRIRDLQNETVAPSNNDFLVIDNGTTNKVTRGNLLAGTPLPADTVNAQAIEDNAVTNNKVANNAVSTNKIQDGAVTDAKIQKTVAFSAERSTNQAIGGNAFTKIVFNSAPVNIGNHYSTSTGTFTVPTSGLYFLTAMVSVDATDRNLIQCRIRVNGSARLRSAQRPGSSGATSPSITYHLFLSQGDTVEVDAATNGPATNVLDDGRTLFSAVMLSEQT